MGHIGAAHVASVLTLPAPERLQMLQHAEQQRWSVRELRDEVVRVRRGRGERRGRPATRSEYCELAVMEASLRRSSQAVRTISEVGALDEQSRSALRDLARGFAALSARLDELGNGHEQRIA